MKQLLVLMLALFIAACGGGDGGEDCFTGSVIEDEAGATIRIDRADCPDPTPPDPDPDPIPDPPPPDPDPEPVPEGDGTLLFLDIPAAPAGSIIRVLALDTALDAVVRVAGKQQQVVRNVTSDGTSNTRPLPEHEGLMVAGLTPTWEGEHYRLIEVLLSDVTTGDTTLTIDGVPGELALTVTDGQIHQVTSVAGWNAIQPAPGDVVYFREGEYTVDLQFGTSQGYALSAWPGEAVTILGGVGTGGASGGDVTFAGFTIVNSTPPSVKNDNVRFVYNDVSGGDAPFANCLGINVVTNLVVQGNWFHDAGQFGNSTSECVYAFGFGVNAGMIIQHNQISQFVGKGNILVFGHSDGEELTGLDISYNLIHDSAGGVRPQGIIITGTDAPSKLPWVKDARIHGNTILNFPVAGVVLAQPCPVISESLMVTDFRFNVLRGNGTDANIINVAPGSVAEGNVTEDPDWGGGCLGETFPVDPDLEQL